MNEYDMEEYTTTFCGSADASDKEGRNASKVQGSGEKKISEKGNKERNRPSGFLEEDDSPNLNSRKA